MNDKKDQVFYYIEPTRSIEDEMRLRDKRELKQKLKKVREKKKPHLDAGPLRSQPLRRLF